MAKKKIWQKPTIVLLDRGHVEGGANPGYHEKNYTGSQPGAPFGFPGQFALSTPGGKIFANHKLSFYYS